MYLQERGADLGLIVSRNLADLIIAHCQGLKRFEEAYGRMPDIVSIASNFWDMAGM